MGIKLLWSGLTFILALTPALQTMGLNVNAGVMVLLGALLMVGGCILMWLDK